MDCCIMRWTHTKTVMCTVYYRNRISILMRTVSKMSEKKCLLNIRKYGRNKMTSYKNAYKKKNLFRCFPPFSYNSNISTVVLRYLIILKSFVALSILCFLVLPMARVSIKHVLAFKARIIVVMSSSPKSLQAITHHST